MNILPTIQMRLLHTKGLGSNKFKLEKINVLQNNKMLCIKFICQKLKD